MRITGKTLQSVVESLRVLVDVEVLVGFPEETAERDAEDTPITNAALAYIHDNGAPEQNIPARKFMRPAMDSVQEKLTLRLGNTLKGVLKGASPLQVEQGMHAVGLLAKLAIQNKINEGIPPPLAASTLARRVAKGRTGTKPLVDTAQLRNAANYAIRSRKKRR
jgi:hypothetical protein